MAIYGYARVSTTEQADGTSIEGQRRRIKGIAQALAADDPTFDPTRMVIYADEGISGSVPMEARPEGGFMFESLARGDTVVVAKMDRAFRSAEDALAKARWFHDNGVDLVIADLGTEPVMRNGVAKLFFTMLAAMAEFERERILERTRDGRRAKRAAGGYTGGRPPFGFKVVGKGREARLEKLPEAEPIIERVVQLRHQGLSLKRISNAVWEEFSEYVSHVAVRNMCRAMGVEKGEDVAPAHSAD